MDTSPHIWQIRYPFRYLIPACLKANFFPVSVCRIWDPVIASWVFNTDHDSYTWTDILFTLYNDVASRDLKTNIEFFFEDVIKTFDVWSDLVTKLGTDGIRFVTQHQQKATS